MMTRSTTSDARKMDKHVTYDQSDGPPTLLELVRHDHLCGRCNIVRSTH